LKVGSVVVADGIVAPDGERLAASPVLADRLCTRLAASAQAVERCPIAGVEAPVMVAAEKALLANRTGAAAVDMESHRAAAFALAHDIPFAAIRVISDSASRTLPPLVGRAMRPDGSVDVVTVVRDLLSDVSQLAPLARTAIDAGIAFRRLRRVRGLLGPGFGLHL
jgi:nucleoside phosphorylase